MACFCVLMAQNRYIFLPPNSLDSPTKDASILDTAKSTSILNCKNVGVTWRVSNFEELVGEIYDRRWLVISGSGEMHNSTIHHCFFRQLIHN